MLMSFARNLPGNQIVSPNADASMAAWMPTLESVDPSATAP
jgi:hypothetical protein